MANTRLKGEAYTLSKGLSYKPFSSDHCGTDEEFIDTICEWLAHGWLHTATSTTTGKYIELRFSRMNVAGKWMRRQIKIWQD